MGYVQWVKAEEKHDGANKNILESSSDPLLASYIPLIVLKFYFWIWWGKYSRVKADQKHDGAI